MTIPENWNAILSPYTYLQTDLELKKKISEDQRLVWLALLCHCEKKDQLQAFMNTIDTSTPDVWNSRAGRFLKNWILLFMADTEPATQCKNTLLSTIKEKPKSQDELCLLQWSFSREQQLDRAVPTESKEDLFSIFSREWMGAGQLSVAVADGKELHWKQQAYGQSELLSNLSHVFPDKTNEFFGSTVLGTIQNVRLDWSEACFIAHFKEGGGLCLLSPANENLIWNSTVLGEVVHRGAEYMRWCDLDKQNNPHKTLSSVSAATMVASETIEDCLGFLSMDKNLLAACLMNGRGQFLFPEIDTPGALRMYLAYFGTRFGIDTKDWNTWGAGLPNTGLTYHLGDYFIRLQKIDSWCLAILGDGQYLNVFSNQIHRLASQMEMILRKREGVHWSSFASFWESEWDLLAYAKLSAKGVITSEAHKEHASVKTLAEFSLWLRSRTKPWEDSTGLGTLQSVCLQLKHGIITLLPLGDNYLITLASAHASMDWVIMKSRQLSHLL